MEIKTKAFCLLSLLFAATSATAGEIVVRPGGSINDALRQAREWRRTGDARCDGGITITLGGNTCMLTEPLFVRPEDSGTAESPLIIRGGTLSGGQKMPSAQRKQVWPAKGMERLLAFNTHERTITIPTPPDSVMALLSPAMQQPARLEMVVHQRWAIAILRVKGMQVRGDSTIVQFMEPESRLEFEHPWPQPVISPTATDGGWQGATSSFLLRTVSQQPGLEQLLVIAGTEEQPVSNVRFDNMSFTFTTWNRPLLMGHVTLQGGLPLIDAYKLKDNPGLPWDDGLENQAWVERPVSAVSVSHSANISFSHCAFTFTGSTALDFVFDTSNCCVTECVFENIGGTAIMAGSFAESPREVHRPYGNLAARCRGLSIVNNRISSVGMEDWGAVAIGCGYVSDTEIAFNFVDGCPYSGICVGWGWTPHDTGMRNNHIHHNYVRHYACQLYDAGGIYTLSNQPGSSIHDNLIDQPAKAPYATNRRAFTIYLDARSDGFDIRNNTTDSHIAKRRIEGRRTIRRDEVGDNHPGPNITFVERDKNYKPYHPSYPNVTSSTN